jgi:hypothetical protein
MRPLVNNALAVGVILALTMAFVSSALGQNEDKAKPPAKQADQGRMGPMMGGQGMGQMT